MPVFFFPCHASARTDPCSAILNHVNSLYRNGSSYAVISVKVVTVHSTRHMRVQVWSKGEKYILVRTLEPAQDRGTATLKSAGSVWTYLPAVDRVISVPRSLLDAPWMESHLTTGDVMMDRIHADEYVAEVSFSGAREGTEVVEITLFPKPAAAAAWSKAVVRVRRTDWIPVRIEYFREPTGPARTLTFSDIRDLGGRKLPTTIRVIPADAENEYTEITYETIRFDVDIDDDFFSLKRLRNQAIP